jgi:hypothetical protein
VNSDYDLARAKALLDLYDYVDHDDDGWRDQPDGTPLVLQYATQPDQQSRDQKHPPGPDPDGRTHIIDELA